MLTTTSSVVVWPVVVTGDLARWLLPVAPPRSAGEVRTR